MTTTSGGARERRAAVFFEIHNDLPRESPGDAASTHRAYRLTADLPATGWILDVGCGPGAQTIDLASVSAANVVALDIHKPYLDQLRARAAAAGVSDRVHAVQASMADMPFVVAGTFDIIWAEGSIYILGFERGLRKWRRLLHPEGHVVVTELSWLSSDVPDEPRAFWNRHYPAMRSIDENVAIAADCGYELIERFTLPESAWWSEYYGPLEMHLASLKDKYGDDDEALGVIESSREQVLLYRRFSRYYGYVFYVLRVRQ